MLNRLHARLSAAALALVLTACAAPAPPAPVEIRKGVIEQITPTQIASNQHAGVGAVLASFTSLVFSLSFVLRTRSQALVRTLSLSMVAVGVAGVVGLLLSHWAQPFVLRVVDFARTAQP